MAKSKSASAVLVLIQRSCARHEPSLPKASVTTKSAKMVGLGVGTVAKLKNELVEVADAA
jgi:hypothetical protein